MEFQAERVSVDTLLNSFRHPTTQELRYLGQSCNFSGINSFTSIKNVLVFLKSFIIFYIFLLILLAYLVIIYLLPISAAILNNLYLFININTKDIFWLLRWQKNTRTDKSFMRREFFFPWGFTNWKKCLMLSLFFFISKTSLFFIPLFPSFSSRQHKNTSTFAACML